jgi:hypothetical protein
MVYFQSNIETSKIVQDRIFHAFRNFTMSAYKSLLQKIIRFSPEYIELGDNKSNIESESVLIACLGKLASHPGAFIPDIQRYVSGLESMFKRLAVTIYEDSNILSTSYSDLFSMLVSSLLSQRVKSWRPSKNISIYSLNSNVAVNVDYHGEITKQPYTLEYGTSKKSILESSSSILDELKSFPTDLGIIQISNIQVIYFLDLL